MRGINAKAALVAAQGKMADAYKNYENPETVVTKASIKDLTDIVENFGFGYTATAYVESAPTREMYKITAFTYYSDEYKQTASWNATDGQWTVTNGNSLAGTVSP